MRVLVILACTHPLYYSSIQSTGPAKKKIHPIFQEHVKKCNRLSPVSLEVAGSKKHQEFSLSLLGDVVFEK